MPPRYYALMELRHLRYFIAVARRLSFTKAAETLRLSQPSLSRQIRELERAVGTPLLDRSGKSIRLTAAGDYFLCEAERLVDGIDAACSTARDIASRSRVLSIGCVHFFFSKGLAPLLEKLREEDPGLKVEIRILSTEAQEKALLSGGIELGFVRSWVRGNPLSFEPMTEESLSILFHSSVPMPSGASATECLSALSGLPYIGLAPSAASGLVDVIDSACGAFGLRPEPSYVCNDTFSIISLVSAGLGWSLLPNFELTDKLPSNLRSLSLPCKKIVIGVSYREESLSPEGAHFLVRAREHFGYRG